MHTASWLLLLCLAIVAALASPVDQKLPQEDGPTHFAIGFGTGGLTPPYDNITAMRDMFRAWAASDNAPHWTDDYKTICETREYFDAEIYTLDPAKPHPSWDWAFEKLDACFSGPYPGGFDEHETVHRTVRAKFADLPKSVQLWVNKDPSYKDSRGFCHENSVCVVDGFAWFPPGWMLAHLPLFVDSAKCNGVFSTMELHDKEIDGQRVSASITGKSEFGNSLRVQVHARLHQRKTLTKEEL